MQNIKIFMKLDNGMQISVLKGEMSDGDSEKPYEVGIIRSSSQKEPEIHFFSEEEIWPELQKLIEGN